jgi:hypothetical protein
MAVRYGGYIKCLEHAVTEVIEVKVTLLEDWTWG